MTDKYPTRATIDVEYNDGTTDSFVITGPRKFKLVQVPGKVSWYGAFETYPVVQIEVTMDELSTFKQEERPTAYFTLAEAREIIRREDLADLLKKIESGR